MLFHYKMEEEEELVEEKELVKEKELEDIRLEDIRDKQILYFFIIKKIETDYLFISYIK